MTATGTGVRPTGEAAFQSADGQDGNGVLIGKVLAEVQRALQGARAKMDASRFPAFAAVTLTLQTVITRSVGGKIKIWIFSFGKSWEKERSHEMVLSLKPPSADAARALLTEQTLAQDLEDAIVEAAEGVSAAERGTPPLSLSTFDVTVSFVVTQDTSGGAEFTISPVTLELNGDLKKKAVHTVKLEFKR